MPHKKLVYLGTAGLRRPLSRAVTHTYRLVGSCNDQTRDLIRLCQYLSRLTGLLLFQRPHVVSAAAQPPPPPCCAAPLFIHCLDFVRGSSGRPSALVIPLLSGSFLYDLPAGGGGSERTSLSLCINSSRPYQPPHNHNKQRFHLAACLDIKGQVFLWNSRGRRDLHAIA